MNANEQPSGQGPEERIKVIESEVNAWRKGKPSSNEEFLHRERGSLEGTETAKRFVYAMKYQERLDHIRTQLNLRRKLRAKIESSAEYGRYLEQTKLEERIARLEFVLRTETNVHRAIWERETLRDRIAQSPSPRPGDIQRLSDLDKRITNYQYQEEMLTDVLDANEKYVTLLRAHTHAASLRDRPTEQLALQQRTDVLDVLDQQSLLAKIRRARAEDDQQLIPLFTQFLTNEAAHYQNHEPELKPQKVLKQKRLEAIREKLSKGAREPMETELGEFERHLEQRLSAVLSRAVPMEYDQRGMLHIAKDRIRELIYGTQPDRQMVVLPHAMRIHLTERLLHDTVGKRMESGIGESTQERLRGEQAAIVRDQRAAHRESVESFTRILRLLTLQGHIDQPDGKSFPNPPKEFKQFSTLNPETKAYLDMERNRFLVAWDSYIAAFEKEANVGLVPFLNGQNFDPSLLLDYVITKAAPANFVAQDFYATLATAPAFFHDIAFHAVGLKTHLHEWRRRALMEPLYAKFGLPANYYDLSFGEQLKYWTDPEKKNDRMETLKEVLQKYYRRNRDIFERVKSDKSTLNAMLRIPEMDPESLSSVTEIVEPDAERLRREGIDYVRQLTRKEEIAGVYVFLMRRIAIDHAQAIADAYDELLTSLNSKLDIEIDKYHANKNFLSDMLVEGAKEFGVLGLEYLFVRHVVVKSVRRGAGKVVGRMFGRPSATAAHLERAGATAGTIGREGQAVESAVQTRPGLLRVGGKWLLRGAGVAAAAAEGWEIKSEIDRAQALREGRETLKSELKTLFPPDRFDRVGTTFVHKESGIVVDTAKLFEVNADLFALAYRSAAVAGGLMIVSLSALATGGLTGGMLLGLTVPLGVIASIEKDRREAAKIRRFILDCPQEIMNMLPIEEALGMHLLQASQKIHEGSLWHAFSVLPEPETRIAKEKIADTLLLRKLQELSPFHLNLHMEGGKVVGVFGPLPAEMYRPKDELEILLHPLNDSQKSQTVIDRAAYRILRCYLVQGYLRARYAEFEPDKPLSDQQKEELRTLEHLLLKQPFTREMKLEQALRAMEWTDHGKGNPISVLAYGLQRSIGKGGDITLQPKVYLAEALDEDPPKRKDERRESP